MPGQTGLDKVTVQNLQIVEVNHENGYLLVKGSVPGPKNGFVKVSLANKVKE
jgi:large subunit ribosomal protein L3